MKNNTIPSVTPRKINTRNDTQISHIKLGDVEIKIHSHFDTRKNLVDALFSIAHKLLKEKSVQP